MTVAIWRRWELGLRKMASTHPLRAGDWPFGMVNQNTCIKDASGFNKAVRKMDVVKVNRFGKGAAVLMNLSPQWYNAYRVAGYDAALKRDVFMKHVKAAGANRWVWLQGAGEREHGYEITYWVKDGRTILFLCFNPELSGSETGGGHAAGLKTETVPVVVEFAASVSDVRDERAGRNLGNGKEFKFTWPMNQAIVLSFVGVPPRP
jgi:hypothetical protein